jgi:hypothetical protein
MTPEEKAKRHGVPLIPKLPERRNTFDPNPVVAVCGECGREVREVEGYWCPIALCPVQVKAT